MSCLKYTDAYIIEVFNSTGEGTYSAAARKMGITLLAFKGLVSRRGLESKLKLSGPAAARSKIMKKKWEKAKKMPKPSNRTSDVSKEPFPTSLIASLLASRVVSKEDILIAGAKAIVSNLSSSDKKKVKEIMARSILDSIEL